MKFKNLAAGLLVGVTSGTLIAVMNAPKSGNELQSSLKSGSEDINSQTYQLKVEANEVKLSFLQTKHESQEVFKTLGNEIRTMIDNYKADVNPNIDHIKNYVNNIQNRVEQIQSTFSKDK